MTNIKKNIIKKENRLMKLFKPVDEKFAEIGFVKVEENKYGVTYKRKVDE